MKALRFDYLNALLWSKQHKAWKYFFTVAILQISMVATIETFVPQLQKFSPIFLVCYVFPFLFFPSKP